MAHFKGLHLQKLLEQKAKETTQYKEKAEENISAAEKLISDGKKVEADLSKAEEYLSQAKTHLNGKNYMAAAEYAERSIEEAKRAHYGRISGFIASAENMVTLTQKIGADVTRAGEYLTRAKTALEHDEFNRALDFANQSWKENEKILREHLSKAFSQAQSLILFGKNLGQDTSTAEESLKSARDAMESGNYELALSLANQCVDAVGVGVSEGVSKILDETRFLLGNVDSEEDAIKVNELITSCMADIEKYDYEKAMTCAKRAKLEGENALKKSITGKIQQFEKSLDEADNTGTDTVKFRESLNEVKTALKSGDYATALEHLNKVKGETEGAQMQRVLNIIGQSRNSFVYARKIGVDITQVLASLEKARMLMRDGKYDEALRLAEKGKAEVERIVDDFQSTANEVKSVQDSISSAERMGIDMTSMRLSLESAKAALMAKDFKKAKDIAKKCIEELNSTIYTKTLEIVEGTEQLMLIADKIGANTPESRAAVEKSVSALKLKDYKKAIELAKRYKAEINPVMKAKLEELINMTKEEFEKHAGNPSLDLTDAKELFEDAKTPFKSGDYEKTFTLITEARKDLDEAQWSEAKKIFDYIKESIDTIKKHGGDVSGPEKTLELVTQCVENKQFSKAAELCDKALDEMRVVEQKFAEEMFFAAKLAVIEVKKTGGDIAALRELLKLAKTAMDGGDFREAYKCALHAKQDADKSKALYEETFEAMSVAAALIAEAKKFNVDATKAIERLLAARSAFVKGDYSKAKEIAYECKDEANRIMSRFTSAKKIITVTEKIALAENLGFDTRKPKESLEKATNAVKAGNYPNSLELATLAENELEELFTDSITFMITSTESLIKQTKANDVDTSHAEKLISDAKEALGSKMYEEAVLCISSARENIIKTAERSQKISNDIKRIEIKLTEAEAVHVDVSYVKGIFAQANDAYNANNYSQAQTLAIKALEELEKAEQVFISKITDKLRGDLEKAKAMGIIVTIPEGMLMQSHAAIERMDVNAALDAAMGCESELRKLIHQDDIAAKAISAATGRITETEKAGVFPKKAKGMLESAKELVKEGNYAGAIDAANQTAEFCSSSIEKSKSTNDLLKKMDDLIRNVTIMGISVDFTRSKELAAKAIKSLEENEYEAAHGFATSAFDTIKKMVEGNISSVLYKLDDTAKKCEGVGLDITEVQNCFATVRIHVAFAEYDKALNAINNANSELTKVMNKGSPKIVISLEFERPAIVGDWADVVLSLNNVGKSPGCRVNVSLSGNVEVTGLREIPEIKENSTEKMAIRIKPFVQGDLPITIKVDVVRVFDGKVHSMEDVKRIHVEPPHPAQGLTSQTATPQQSSQYPQSQSGYSQQLTQSKYAPSTQQNGLQSPIQQPAGRRCEMCHGKIRPNQLTIVCSCGKVYHQMCGTRAEKCKSCGADLVQDSQTQSGAPPPAPTQQ